MKLIPQEREIEMQNPYNRYQQNAGIKPKQKTQVQKVSQTPRPVVKNNAVKKKVEKEPIGLGLITLSFMGLCLSFYIFAYTDDFINLLGRLNISFSSVSAADGEKDASKSEKKMEKTAPLPVGETSSLNVGEDSLTMQNTSVFNALKDKNRELEKKERQLALLEEDLHKQKMEIEKQLLEMKEMRRNISSKLDEKVIADQESVNKLVGVYSDMKPQSAATILSTIDEQLAIQVLSKMKKQNAAAILNFMEPQKAQVLSEKYVGIKK
jgi:flagellar motility protein MotE (MotC chaperone)